MMLTPHKQYISGLRWAGGENSCPKLFSGSYDGSLRCLDPTTGQFDLVVSSEDAEFSSMDCTADGNVVVMGDNDGYMHVFDVRERKGSLREKEVELHTKRINTLHISLVGVQFAPGEENLLVSSSSDNSLAVWDVRTLSQSGKFKHVAAGVHSKTCQSAYFCPDGSKRIVSLSRDDTVQVWQLDKKSSLESVVNIHHYNNTGRWVMPFRATWSPSGDSIIVGNMKRQVDLFAADGDLLGRLQSEYMTAISSRAAVHPHYSIVAAATASGRVHIYR